MSDIAIKVENLGKSYLLGHNDTETERYTALRDVITHNAKNLARKTRDMLQGKSIVQGDEIEEFWALRNLNFEIGHGDRVGIIGRNGAGKSTLLKILSRITEPTNGKITINGRVASLLEVGTGFHPELTGRENIYLNGAILGMNRKEIKSKFDAIIDFSEVEKFLDTPVKRYSSGMYVRLAFAVAAHLEPEILIVDEVLAVGDAKFQDKCLAKMRDVSKQGRTILFVSHNIGAIKTFCNRALYLKNGHVICDDNTEVTVNKYLLEGSNFSNGLKFDKKNKNEYISSIEILNKDYNSQSNFQIGEALILNIKINNAKKKKYQISFIVQKNDGTNIYHCKSIDSLDFIQASSDELNLYVKFDMIKLYPGTYKLIDVWLADISGQTIDIKSETVVFNVLSGGNMIKRELYSHAGLLHETPSWEFE